MWAWVQPWGLASHPAGPHLPGVMLLALYVCVGWAGATGKPRTEPKQLQRSAVCHTPCSPVGPAAPVSTLAGHWAYRDKWGKASGTCALWGNIKDGWKEAKKPTCFVMVVQAFPSLHPFPLPWWFSAKSALLCEMWLISSSFFWGTGRLKQEQCTVMDL